MWAKIVLFNKLVYKIKNSKVIHILPSAGQFQDWNLSLFSPLFHIPCLFSLITMNFLSIFFWFVVHLPFLLCGSCCWSSIVDCNPKRKPLRSVFCAAVLLLCVIFPQLVPRFGGGGVDALAFARLAFSLCTDSHRSLPSFSKTL